MDTYSTHDLQIMLDIETLGKRPGCVILSIGAVVFSLSGQTDMLAVGQEFYSAISIKRTTITGLNIDRDTLEWWLTQPEALKKYTKEPKEDTDVALCNFSKWFNPLLPLWSNGPSFDEAILGEAFHRVNGEAPPWKYNAGRDCRTIFALAGFDMKKEPRTGTFHNALDDAKFQAACVQKCYRKLMGLDEFMK